ncbi:Cytidylyltransferase family domain containing protein [Naviculisporaceae sp. PSN 640]
MTGKSRRGVKFPHRMGNNGQEARRASTGDATNDQEPTVASEEVSVVKNEQPTSAEEKAAEYEKKKQNFITRTLWTFVMIAGFFTALFMGHIYVLCIITYIQIVSFKEVIAISAVPSRERDLRPTKNLNWYWLASTMYFLYGESCIYYFKHIVLVDKVLLPLATHHRFISFILYVLGFVFFVGSLKTGHLKFQFAQFGWTHMALFLIIVQSHFIINNVLEGLIWFFLPAALVITNDIFAYICGITFGRTQLIKLSPKKTVEGFVGAWIMTVLFGIFLTSLLIRSKYFICPATDLGANIFSSLECEPNPVFIPKTFTTPELFFLPPHTTFSVTLAPMQIHTFFWATFASLIAPFGGFFASGLKRTFRIKDFGHSIPGHGGMTDRMDCQFVMGLFAYLYYHSFIEFHQYNLGDVVQSAVTGLTTAQQIALVKQMSQYLVNQGVAEQDLLQCVNNAFLPQAPQS